MRQGRRDTEGELGGERSRPASVRNASDRRGDTVPFELQLHTQDSFATKQEIHGMYEEARAAGTSPARVAELNKAMEERCKQVPVPKGIKSL